jgi:hypothetical protein
MLLLAVSGGLYVVPEFLYISASFERYWLVYFTHPSRVWDLWRMSSSGMLRHVALIRANVSEEPSASIIMVTRIVDPGITLDVTNNRRKLRRNTKYTNTYTNSTKT